jgi:stearoyl-CoA desaturase (delta-9 desaturase)
LLTYNLPLQLSPTPLPPLTTVDMTSHQTAVDPALVSEQSSSMASKSEPNRNSKHDARKPHITETPITWQNWYQHVNWLNVYFIGGIPLIGCIAAAFTPLRWQTALWAVVYYFFTGLGITAGYHRLWAHKSYNARRPLEFFLALTGGGAVEGSIRWWSRDHRAHHRYTDTSKDPYSVRKGLLYSHLGWMVSYSPPYTLKLSTD